MASAVELEIADIFNFTPSANYTLGRESMARSMAHFSSNQGLFFGIDIGRLRSCVGRMNEQERLALAVSGRVAERGFLYSSKHFVFEWPNFLSRAVKEATRLVSGLIPVTSEGPVSIDLELLSRREVSGNAVVITGLNGAGKSTAIKAVDLFLDRIGIRHSNVKFPTEGAIGDLLRGQLNGLTIGREQLQMLFWADGMGTPLDSLTICDRHPLYDAIVYVPDNIRALATIMYALNPRPAEVIVLDRHPLACLERVTSRDSVPRIFEAKSDQMLGQLARLYGLTALPGVIVVNNDLVVSEDSPIADVLRLACQRVLVALSNTRAFEKACAATGRNVNGMNWTVIEAINDVTHEIYPEKR